ncbi:phosphonate metabolism protein/1,5-bisphosphokinase (PRPP-forming) PhnN [Oricola sp.]|uniref:phosphonate metabolism protein/1,5-bisphosphokinase (PRPP-forming) PhnN n=1 Tax=Oricola sp. TaxID=1979950 RepID=UPI003BA99E53
MSPDATNRGGSFVAVVGPSGAGKDTLIDEARRVFEGRDDIMFVRRVITRDAMIGAEDHDTLTQAAFEQALAEGRFAVDWQAHGLRYGIPREALVHVQNGGVAIANCSRGALAVIQGRFPRVAVISVTARPDVLADRLAARGRESRADIERRLARTVPSFEVNADAVEIDNSDSLDLAVARFVKCLSDFARG